MILETIDSTQFELKRRLEQNPNLPNLSFVQALTQTEGRGRQDRNWSSPRGNFYLSVLLRGPFHTPTWVPLLVAYQLKFAIEECFELKESIYIKWPNDLMTLRWEKLSGVLCEKIGDHIIAGVGVNLDITPDLTERLVTSVKRSSHGKLHENASDELREHFLSRLSALPEAETLKRDFDSFSLFRIGDHIAWNDLYEKLPCSGIVKGLGDFGELLVEQDGVTSRLLTEEVTGLKAINRRLSQSE